MKLKSAILGAPAWGSSWPRCQCWRTIPSPPNSTSAKPITLKGKFVKMDWVNPHSQIHIDVTDADGKVISWSCEALPPNGLYRQGWRKDSLKPGEEIEIEGFAAKDGTSSMWTRSVKTADGRRMFAGSADALPPARRAKRREQIDA